MYQIKLSGSHTAACEEFNVSIVRKKHSVIDVCARAMLEAGADPECLVKVTRGETLCFKPAKLGLWAEIRTLEHDNEPRSFSTRRFKALDRTDAFRV